jgi:hypothetical protein
MLTGKMTTAKSIALAILIPRDVSKNLDPAFPSNLLRVGDGREAVKQWRPSRSAPGVSRGTVNRMDCGCMLERNL